MAATPTSGNGQQQQQDEEMKPFRFRDLSAELRNRVYSIYMQDLGSGAFNLARFKAPAIARASRQLRSESLPIFFAECKFYVDVPSNLVDHSDWRSTKWDRPFGHHWNDTITDKMQRSGVLEVKQIVKNLMRQSGRSIIVRDINFRVYEIAYYWKPLVDDSGEYMGEHRAEKDVIVTVRLIARPLTVDRLPRNGVWASELGSADECDIQFAVDLVKQRAGEFAGREEFKGFTLQDLEKIANAFRFTE